MNALQFQCTLSREDIEILLMMSTLIKSRYIQPGKRSITSLIPFLPVTSNMRSSNVTM